MISGTQVVLIVLLVFAGGLVFVGVGIYLFFVIKAIRDLNETLKRTADVLKPLTEGVGLSDVLQQVKYSSKVAIELGRRVDMLISTLNMFQKAIFRQGGEGAPPNLEVQADETNSAFFTASEEHAAMQEKVRELKRRGINIDERTAYQPQEEEGKTTTEEQPI